MNEECFTGFYKNSKNQFNWFINIEFILCMLLTKSTIGECYNIALFIMKHAKLRVTFSQQHLTETLSSPKWKCYAVLVAIFTLEILLYDVLL